MSAGASNRTVDETAYFPQTSCVAIEEERTPPLKKREIRRASILAHFSG